MLCQKFLAPEGLKDDVTFGPPPPPRALTDDVIYERSFS